MRKPSISVITCSVDPKKRATIQRHYQKLLGGERYEFILIPDARSLCEGYNRGFARSTGEIMIFSHDDIEILSDDFAPRLLAHFETHDLVGLAGTSKLVGPAWHMAGQPNVHGVYARPAPPPDSGYFLEISGPPTDRAQAFDGLFFAARRNVCTKISFDADTFDGWDLYDLDFTWRAFCAGFRLKIPIDIFALHYSRGGIGGEKWREYAARFTQKYQGQIAFSDQQGPPGRYYHLRSKGALIGAHRKLIGSTAAQRPSG